MKIDNSIFNSVLNEILLKNNYFDTTETIFKNRGNTAYVSAKVKRISFEEVYERAARTYNEFIVGNADIEWEIFDLYDQSLYKKEISSTSGKFSYDFYNDEVVNTCMEDIINTSFFQLINKEEVLNILKLGEDSEQEMDRIKIESNKFISNLEEAIESTVTIKTEKGHGSGCAISNDGYIITNFHVVSGNDVEKINVILKNGEKIEAELIRKNIKYDLALLKVNKSFDLVYKLPTSPKFKIGQDVYAIGTPSNIDLGQTLSKGIVSGIRNNEGQTKFIQTDASINSGNSGGALVSKNGELLGLVNAKLFGFGVEGLAFAIPAEDVLKNLFIEY